MEYKEENIFEMKTYNIATILLNYNSEEDLFESVMQLLVQKEINQKIIIVDNSSKKETIEKIKNWQKKEFPIVDENYSSDVQQNIIKKSKFVIGARYHSIVFSINNNKQFISLSYENKMKNIFEILALEDYSLDMTKLPTENIEELYLSKISNLVDEYISKPNHIENDKPIEMAKSCFTKLKQFLVN
jgi:polysaccharide pyruvyl transferase WcaK-like protein